MIRNLLLAFAAPVVLSNSYEPRPEYDTPPVFVAIDGIARVICAGGSGTAFRTGPRTWTSVDHVTSLGECMINGKRIRNVDSHKALDYSMSSTPKGGAVLKVDCGGFRKGRIYAAVGYARGSINIQRAVFATPLDVPPRLRWADFTALIGDGRFIPGQSGGPVIDIETMRVVGIAKGFNTYPGVSYARSLRDTPICR